MKSSIAQRFVNVLLSLSLHVFRAAGGFSLAQFLTRRRLRILCYHGFSQGDEHKVAPYMFMRRETFERRMHILKRRKIPVVTLDDAISRFRERRISNSETVITFDDGWESNLTVAAPILKYHGFPGCIYITTEHLGAGAGRETFNVVLYYMLCRAPARTFKLEGIHPGIDGSYDIGANAEDLLIKLIHAVETAFPQLSDRQQLLRPIATALGMDLDQVLSNGRFRLLSRGAIEELSRSGFDIQLHTHTHRLPDDDFEAMADEIARNRAALKEILGRVQSHLCYPSGKHGANHLEWLPKLGILSATTCDPGLNVPSTPPLLLKRYLDSDEVSDITFEAEICGFRDLLRNLRARFRV